ncbi:unnamed protein product [Auanema sp. JU1783]|nr:unnamed protein product [Auanema sp. JU1783]
MSNNVGKVRSIRLCVEPVEVELDEDDGIKWTSLQTAFPGCSGMYFRDREKDCRSSVKFDGEKFKPPGGAWNDREYFVHLSQRCHSSNMSSYESATKTFEKNVQVVQQLISATMGGSRRRVALSPNMSKHSASSASVSSDLTVTSLEQERPLQSSIAVKEMTPLEQQFADLAKISTGKDIIIENLREEIKKLNEKLEDNQKNLQKCDTQLKESESRVEAFETELNLLRSMADDQQSMNNRVTSLTLDVEEKTKEIASLQNLLTEGEESWKKDQLSLQEKINLQAAELEEKSLELAEVSENLELALSSKSVLSNEIEQLRPLADAIQLEGEDNVLTYMQMKIELNSARDRLQKLETDNSQLKQSFETTAATERSLVIDNTRLMERNSKLEDRMANVDSDMKKINEEWKSTIESTRKEWGRTKLEAEKEVDSMKQQISNLQRLLEASTRDATDNARRLEESNKNVSKLRKDLENAELRQQEPLKRQVETLSSDLSGAEARILELVSLVSSLTADAHNSRRDMDDLI